MRWWGWLILAVVALFLISFVVTLVKATIWIIVCGALFIALIWLAGWVYRVLSNMWPG